MPEGPEIKELANALHLFTVKRGITKIVSLSSYDDGEMTGFLDINEPYDTVFSRGKKVVWRTTTGTVIVSSHGLRGTWSWMEAISAKTRFILILEDADKNLVNVLFQDPINLGTVEAYESEEESILRSLGPDWCNDDVSLDYFRNVLNTKRNCMISGVLIDQSLWCGVGNYIRSEAIHLARIHPRTKCKDIANPVDLYEALRNICSDPNYTLQVYKKDKTSNGEIVNTIKLGGSMVYTVL